MAIIDPTRTWEPLEKRLANTTNERHRVALRAVTEHMKAEAAADMQRLMATLSPAPDYHFWGAEGDFGPKTTEGVQTYYTDFMSTRTNILEFEVQRLVVDDHCVVTEGLLKQIYPGAEAVRIGTEASPDDQAEFRRRFGAELFEGYGSSEGGAAVALDPNAPPSALGRPAHPGVAIVNPETLKDCAPAVFDEYGRVRNPDDAVGEIVDKYGTRTFEGYYKNDDADAERIRNGWYWTGDLGYLDEAGFMYFAGRRGDWIRVDGENTSALTIERVLRRHPHVIAAGVYAVPDPRSGDQVMAALEVADPDAFDTAEFAAYLSAQDDLGSKGIPRFLRLSTKLPVTGSNKVLKRELQQQRWHTDEPVYRWAGRGAPEYGRMHDDGKRLLDEDFVVHGRKRYA